MTEQFADTFFWLALINPNDSYHLRVRQIDLSSVRIVTTRAVQIEVMDALCEVRFRSLAARFWKETSGEGDLLVVPLDEGLIARGADLYLDRHDKDWSMTDCISFVVMKDRAISIALTGDRHFQQAGFQCAFL
jgi:uncharacterized protein